MKNLLNWFICILMLVGLIYLGKCAHQVLSVSATIPPIRIYHFSGSTDSLVRYVRKQVSTDTSLRLDVQSSGYGKDRFYELYLHQSHPRLEFDFKCDSEADSSVLKLIGAMNIDERKGGYGSTVVGINALITRFQELFPVLIPKSI